MHDALRARWDRLLPGHSQVGADLLARYAEPARRYHDLRHLEHVLASLEHVAATVSDDAAVALAAWFHDAVYDVRRDDNEEQSARLAESVLGPLHVPALSVEEVARLVRLTRTHDPAPGDTNGEAICDADLAILGSSAESYAEYVTRVRSEYAHVDDSTFRAGRAAVLRQLLDLPQLFRTPEGHHRWEAAARANVESELYKLLR